MRTQRLATDAQSIWMIALVCAHALSACAAGPNEPAKVTAIPGSSAPSPAPPHRPLTELDALEHDLEVSEGRLLAELERRRADKSAVTIAESAGKGGPSARPKKKHAAEGDTGPKESSLDSRDSEVGAACDLACRALTSMRRSADGICGITGPSEARCLKAQERVKVSAEQVKEAGCGCRTTP